MDQSAQSLLKKNALILSLPEEASAALIAAAHIKTFEPNEEVFNEGDFADAYYGIISGTVSINKITRDGRQAIVTYWKNPIWFGEIPFLDLGLRAQNAHVVDRTVLAVINRSDILRLMNTYTDIYRSLAIQAAYHLRVLYKGIDDLLLISPERRLARRFVDGLSAGNEKQESKATIKINQEELGRLIGVSRQSINGILRNWEKKGLIQRGYGEVTIVSETALRRLVEQD